MNGRGRGVGPVVLPLMPTDGAPAATACSAYSICTNFPEGLSELGRTAARKSTNPI